MNVACLVRDGVDSLEACATFDVMNALPRSRFRLLGPVGNGSGHVTSNAGVRIGVSEAFVEPVTSGFLLVLSGTSAHDAHHAKLVAESREHAELIVGVGAGKDLLKSAGLELPAVDPNTRIGRARGVCIGPGATGIFDLLLTLVGDKWGAHSAGRVQLLLEYDPPCERQ